MIIQQTHEFHIEHQQRVMLLIFTYKGLYRRYSLTKTHFQCGLKKTHLQYTPKRIHLKEHTIYHQKNILIKLLININSMIIF